MKNKSTVFTTGVTGLLGSYLLKILLSRGHKVYALARDKGPVSAQERVAKVLKFWGDNLSLNNLKVLKGDIAQKQLGLDNKTWDLLKDEVSEIYHCAAIVNLKWPLEKIRAINVSGTKNVLDLAYARLKENKPVKTNHISTAYIYGDYTDPFKETDLDVGQKFNTTYEQSKFEAEKVASDYREKGLWVDIFRPPIIIGHSQTGKILKFYNIYQLISLCELNIFNALPVQDAYVRLIPIDWVAEAIYTLASQANVINQNYHVFLKQQVAVKSIIDSGCKLLDIPKPKAVSMNAFDLDNFTPSQRVILRNNLMSINLKNQLNSDQTLDLLKRRGMSFGKIDDALLNNIIGYFLKQQTISGLQHARRW